MLWFIQQQKLGRIFGTCDHDVPDALFVKHVNLIFELLHRSLSQSLVGNRPLQRTSTMMWYTNRWLVLYNQMLFCFVLLFKSFEPSYLK